MRAMVFAAGLGTRLRPLTDTKPKALVTVAGRTLLEITLERLRSFGVTEAIINTHHHAEQISQYLIANRNFGMRIEISHEEELLDTGGGLKRAAWFFDQGGSGEPFFVHNVDVISTIDLNAMAKAHADSGALATLAVQQRKSSRQLLFDEKGWLCGRQKGHNAAPEMARHVNAPESLAFCGIHVISPRIFPLMSETGVFSIIDVYLRLAEHGEKIAAFRADDTKWRDLGTPESVTAAEKQLLASSS